MVDWAKITGDWVTMTNVVSIGRTTTLLSSKDQKIQVKDWADIKGWLLSEVSWSRPNIRHNESREQPNISLVFSNWVPMYQHGLSFANQGVSPKWNITLN